MGGCGATLHARRRVWRRSPPRPLHQRRVTMTPPVDGGPTPSVLLFLLLVACAAAWPNRTRCPPWQCTSSAPAPPQGTAWRLWAASGSQGQRPGHWVPRHCSRQPPAAARASRLVTSPNPIALNPTGAGLGIVAIWSRCGAAAGSSCLGSRPPTRLRTAPEALSLAQGCPLGRREERLLSAAPPGSQGGAAATL